MNNAVDLYIYIYIYVSSQVAAAALPSFAVAARVLLLPQLATAICRLHELAYACGAHLLHVLQVGGHGDASSGLAYEEEEETGTAYLQVRRHEVPACLDAGKEGNIDLASIGIDPAAARRTDHAHRGKPVEGVAGGDHASSSFRSAWRASCGVAACAPSWGA
ncbi:hypothetical protein L7F22_046749 [Adiantum nelumboides]|nr:hypothetical protein [Adiantum nelumboides]